MAGPWLYCISSGLGTFRLSDGVIPVSIENFRELVRSGRIIEDDRWGVKQNGGRIEPHDDLFIYTRDRDLGVIGVAKVIEKRWATDTKEWLEWNPELTGSQAVVRLTFDLERCRSLLDNPIPAAVVRGWGLNLRRNVIDLSSVAGDLHTRLPWSETTSAKDAWGYRIGTGAAAIDEILLAADRPLTADQIVSRIKENGLQERGAVGNHLRSLLNRGFLARTPTGFIRTRNTETAPPHVRSTDANERADDPGTYTPENVDRRRIVERQICERRGQQAFRENLRQRYGDRCAVTGCKVLAVLEAAHINPYRGENDNHVENGLLLRTDIHTLFDLDLLGIEPASLAIEIHPAIESEYANLAGRIVNCPPDKRLSQEALEIRYGLFRDLASQQPAT